MISLFKVFMSNDVIEPVNNVLKSGYITQGPKVDQYETELKNYLENPYVLSLNSATAGLTLATRLLIKKDPDRNWPGFSVKKDIVLTPALTCFATTAAILSNKVNIRWLDTDNTTANICLQGLKNKLNKRTKIIYLVHWGGYPVDLDKLDEILEEHKELYGFKPMVVEDCAHAFGATFKGKKLGNIKHQHICVYSTQAIKTLSTGDGGIITLPNEKLYNRCKLLRWYGIDRNKRNYKKKDFRLEHDITEYGYKFHMNDVNATLGLHNLPHIDGLLEIARDNFQYYHKELADIGGLTLNENDENRNSSCWLFTVRVNNKLEFINKMKEKNIMISQVHQRNDINSCVKQYRESLPNIDQLEKELVCIPVGWWITKPIRKYIVNEIKNFFK
jgi:dTDP-4-amino-4,6-dideoxygalactose transaminase